MDDAIMWCLHGWPPCGGCEECIGAQRAYYAELQRVDDHDASDHELGGLLDAYFHGLLDEPIYQPQEQGQ